MRRRRASPVLIGLIALADRRARVPRLHQGHPVHRAVRGQRRLPVGELDPARLAGADRRRRGRQGEGGRGGRGQPRRRGRRAPDRRRRAAAARGRDRQDPAAHLPRGQLLRRPQARLAGAPELEDGGTIKVTQTATPVQLDQDPDLAAVRHAAGPQGRPPRLWRWRSTPSRRRPRTASPTRRRAARPPPSRSTTPTTTSRRPSGRPRSCSTPSSAPSRAATCRA